MTIHRSLTALAAGFTLALCLGATSAHAQDASQDTTMPATDSQSDALKEMPDNSETSRTGAKGEQAEDMPATKSQQDSLEESGDMSSDDSVEVDEVDADDANMDEDAVTGESSGS